VSAPRTQRAADRIEHALDEHTDVEGEIARGEARRPSRARVIRTLGWLGVTGISLYLVAPTLLETLSSWDDLGTLSPAWLLAIALLQVAALVALWWLQRIAVHCREWFPVATSQLAGNAMAKIAPAGGAVGAAVQYRMLVQGGIERPRAVSGLAAVNVLTLGIVLALPVLATPALVTGTAPARLERAGVAALVVFVVVFAAGLVVIASDRPLRVVGRIVQRVRNALRRHAQPLEHLPARLLHERDRIVDRVGRRWKASLAAGVARWAFDYASLLAALAAVGSTPRPGFVLLAFCAAQLLAQIPLTPGGLGFVEAGLTATLGLAGVSAGDAVLATLAYRLFTYWLPLPVGMAAALLHRRRYASASVTA
jgi:uncharacterized protein (TIRG00374 family)